MNQATNAVRAEILTQAIPYIKEYAGKYVVAEVCYPVKKRA